MQRPISVVLFRCVLFVARTKCCFQMQGRHYVMLNGGLFTLNKRLFLILLLTDPTFNSLDHHCLQLFNEFLLYNINLTFFS